MLVAWVGCDRKAAPGTAAPAERQDGPAATAATGENGGAGNPVAAPATAARTSVPREPTVASLSPAATDILVGMGAADHLVAVSNYDPKREPIGGLPRVGDYRTQDWEKLAAVRPRKMIIQLHPDRTPAGLRDRAKGLGIELVNVQIDDLDDVFEAIPLLAGAVDERQKGEDALKRLRAQFDTVRHRVAAAPKVRAIVVVDVGGRSVAGPGTFLHDCLVAAGGENAAVPLDNPWPTVDREKIQAMRPQVVIHLLPAASPQVLRQAEQFWAAMPDLPAVKDKRVHYLTDWYALLPGYHLGTLAEQFALILHPFANVGPMTAPAPSDVPPARLLQQAPPTGAGSSSSSPSR